MSYSNFIIKINQLKDQWDKLQPLSKEADSKLWEKFRLEWNYNSNHIEGNTLTYGETQLLLVFGKTTGDHDLREYEEMKAHDVAIKAVLEWAKDKKRDLTETDIRNINKIILVKPFWKEALTFDGQPTQREIKVGEYKEYPNSVRLKTGEMFHYASPQETPGLMSELMQWYRKNQNDHALIIASEFHYRFIRIHPFDDGNGRIARLLVNYVLMKNGFPPIIVKSTDKENYLTALQKADAGDREAFHEYMAKQLIWSLELAIKAGKGESIEEPDDIDKEITLWKKQFKGNRANVMPRSASQVYELYDKGFRQLFELFILKHKQFDEMFTGTKVRGYVNGSNLQNKGLEHIEEKLEYFAKSQAQFVNKEGTSEVLAKWEFSQFLLEIIFDGFKNDERNAFNQKSILRIEFQPYVYNIFHNGEQLKENLYSEFINVETAQKLISHSVKKVFEEIKRKIKNSKVT